MSLLDYCLNVEKSDDLANCARPARSILFLRLRRRQFIKEKKIPRVGGDDGETEWECCRPENNYEF